MPIRILVVDDHEVVRQGLRAVIGCVDDLEVVGEAETAREAVLRTRELAPDIVLMDVRLPDATGVEACREILSERPRTRVIMLTAYADEEALFASVLAGASGYLLKRIRAKELIDGIRTVAAGQSLLDPAVTGAVLARLRDGRGAPSDPLVDLTPAERRVLWYIGQGMTNREIAAEMFLSERTVKGYVSSLLSKLGLSRRTEAAALAARLQPHLEDAGSPT